MLSKGKPYGSLCPQCPEHVGFRQNFHLPTVPRLVQQACESRSMGLPWLIECLLRHFCLRWHQAEIPKLMFKSIGHSTLPCPLAAGRAGGATSMGSCRRHLRRPLGSFPNSTMSSTASRGEGESSGRVGRIPRIIKETENFLLVEKPAHQLTHPKRPEQTGTLWHLLREVLAYELTNGGSLSIITRLDRETSGLVLVAKSRATAARLTSCLQRGLIEKEYLAFVHGWPEIDHWRVDAPIIREASVHPSNVWVRHCIHPTGASAQTSFDVLARFSAFDQRPFAMVKARPITGRTHQIRLHLAHSGHPILGDKIYGGDQTAYTDFIETGWTDDLARRLLCPRQALHAWRLSLSDPEAKPSSLLFREESPFPTDLSLLLGEAWDVTLRMCLS